MPGFWKKPAVSRLLSRLRSKRASSPLVVETGFPTSLADLVVKHRARLRNRKPLDRRPSPPPPPPPPPTTTTTTIEGTTTATTTTDAVAVEARCIAPTAPIETGKARWFGFLAVMLLVAVLLVIGWRGLVSGITISAFILLLFDFLEFRVLEFLWSRSRGLDLVERELVSPIREVGVEKASDLLQNCEGSVVGAEVLLERRDLAVVGGDENMICLGTDCLKKKKLWKRFLPKKTRKRRIGRDREEIETDSCSSSPIVSQYKQEEELPIEQERHIEELEESCLEISYRDRDNVVDMEGHDVVKTNLWSSRQLIFIVVALLGLLRGRAMALVVTIGWLLATRSVEILWRKWKAYRSRQFL